VSITQERIDKMTTLLNEALDPSQLDIIDDSAQHVGHAAASTGLGYFTVIIKADAFGGKSLPDQHRMVYEALGDMMHNDIHALRIQVNS